MKLKIRLKADKEVLINPFKRLFGRRTALCICQEHPAIKKLTLPNGLKINVCSVCQEEIERLSSRPIDKAKLEAILNRIPVDKNGIWGFPWNSTPEEVIDKCHPGIAKQLRSSKSKNRMSYYAGIEGETVEASFHFADDGLCEIMISPHGLLTDISQPLIERYGVPYDQYEMPGMFEDSESESKAIWEKDGYEIEIDYTVYGFIAISFIKRSD